VGCREQEARRDESSAKPFERSPKRGVPEKDFKRRHQRKESQKRGDIGNSRKRHRRSSKSKKKVREVSGTATRQNGWRDEKEKKTKTEK